MKIDIFQWRYSPLLLLGFGLFGVGSAHARVQCNSPQMTNLTFAAVDAQSTQTDATATFTITCENNLLLQTRAATICVSIGSDREMKSGTNSLNFQLYQDPSRSIVWGSQFGGPATPLKFDVTLGPRESKSFPATLYGRVLAGQTGINPGIYEKSYPDSSDQARVTVNAPIDDDVPGTCNARPGGSLYIPFTVKVPMIKSCQVTTTGALDFGSVMSGSTPTTTSSSANLINVTCTKNTPYNIGLTPSNGNVDGMGVMVNNPLTDTVDYQLQSNASGQVWGNKNVTATNTGNGVAGIGTGAAKGETVFATVANTDVKPDTYSDTVTVHVNY